MLEVHRSLHYAVSESDVAGDTWVTVPLTDTNILITSLNRSKSKL